MGIEKIILNLKNHTGLTNDRKFKKSYAGLKNNTKFKKSYTMKT